MLNSDNIKGVLLLTVCAEKDAKFPFQINKQFIDSESCCSVDLEQGTGFKNAATGCLSYYRDTNLRRVR